MGSRTGGEKMKKSIFYLASILVATLVLSWAYLTAPGAQSAEVLLGKAIHQEEVEGDFEAAIETYKKLLAGYPDNRPLAAKAQFRIGVCYEKLGWKEAEKAFQKVVDNYPDQTEAVKQAREKLSILQRARAIVEKEDQGIRMTQIPVNPKKYWFCRISPDGKKLANVDRDNNIWLTDLAGGSEVQITQTGLGGQFSWAPDSQKLVSYDANGYYKVVSAQGGTPETLFRYAEISKEYGNFELTSWSQDCQYINYWFYEKGLFGIPISGGEWREIYKYSSPEDAETHGTLILSPNEKFLVYTDTTGNKDIYIMAAEGGEPTQLTDHPANDVGRLWSYDGRWLLFNSDRSGKDELWIIGITPDGKRKGEPFQVPLLSEANLWEDWTKEGQIAFAFRKTISNLFMSNADGSGETQLTNMEWWDGEPRWSPDNKSIAFISNRGGKSDIWLMPAQGGEPKNISARSGVKGGYGNLAWHPSGRSVSCVVGQGMWTIDIDSGSAQRIPFEFFNSVQGMDWSPDGKTIAFCFLYPVEQDETKEFLINKNPNVYTISSEGGEAVVLTKVEEDGLSCAAPRWSSDGKWIAFTDDIGRIWVVDSEGGDPQAITDPLVEKSVGVGWPAWIEGWSPDGENVIFGRIEGEEKKWAVYSIPFRGGELRKINDVQPDDGDISPDGKKVVYSKVIKRTSQYWLIENFLPEKK